MTRLQRQIVLVAGGTGGHLFPAAAVAEELIRRGHEVTILTDERGLRFASVFGSLTIRSVNAGRMTEGGARAKLAAFARLARGYAETHRLFKEWGPAAVIGFGGYASLPALLAALRLGIPSAVHEQNAILGRVNRLLGSLVAAIALSAEKTRRVRRGWRSKTVVTGNPVRADIAVVAEQPYPDLNGEGIIRLLVVGGSQGARILSEVVPVALAALPPSVRNRLQVTQQCRPEDMDTAKARYEEAGIAAHIAEFLDDMPERLAWAHLVIARAGASTLAEIAAAGRPAILVPLPSATDDHQSVNAGLFADAGAGWSISQEEFTPADLAKRVQKLLKHPDQLVAAARQAKGEGRPHAARDVADLAEWLADPDRFRTPREGRAERAASGTPSNPTVERRAA